LRTSSAVRQRSTSLGQENGSDVWTEAQHAPFTSDARNYRFVALQPIVNRHGKIFGNEALSPSGWDICFTGHPNAATWMMVEDWLLHGLDELARGSRIFLNCTREALIGGLLTVLPRTVVIELPETIEADAETLKACRRMKALGYQIALDDFQFSGRTAPLIELADYIKVDFRLCGQEQRGELVRFLRGSRITLLAEKIETKDEFEIAVEQGFHLFQGYYFGRPAIYSKRRRGAYIFPPFEDVGLTHICADVDPEPGSLAHASSSIAMAK